MERIAKTATAAAMALLIAGGAALPAGAVLPGALSGDTITANAYVDVNFDKQTGVLTFSGNISRMLTRSWNYEPGVKKIVFGPGSVLDADSSTMFRCYNEVEEIDLTNADTSNVTDMSSMFAVCPALKKITFGSNFTTKKVWDMSYMFEGCSSLEEIDLSQFDTYSVSDMSGMFSGCISLRSIDLRYIRTDHATNMACMFCN